MNCTYFGECASCTVYDVPYDESLNHKVQTLRNALKPFITQSAILEDMSYFASGDGGFRARVEFRIFHQECQESTDKKKLFYAMHTREKRLLPINDCSMVTANIADKMPLLIDHLQNDELLSHKLFAIEFLSASYSGGELIVTLIYHKRLDEDWLARARALADEMSIFIIGRSRKQKLLTHQEFITERLAINDKPFYFRYYEGELHPAQPPYERTDDKLCDKTSQRD